MAWSDAARRAAVEARRRHKGRLTQVNRLYGSMRNRDKRLLYGESSESLGKMYGLDRGQSRLFRRKLNAGAESGAERARRIMRNEPARRATAQFIQRGAFSESFRRKRRS